MKIEDIDGRFRKFLLSWSAKHQDITSDEKKMEKAVDKLYHKWLDTPMKWLEGKSPNQWFSDIEDPQILVTLMIEYVKQGLELPMPLVQVLMRDKQKVYPILVHLLYAKGEDVTPEEFDDIRAEAVALIEEMQMPHPHDRYLEILSFAEEESALTDEISAVLTDLGEEIHEKILSLYPASAVVGKQVFLEMLSDREGDQRIFDLVEGEIRKGELPREVLAACLGKLRMEKGLSYLDEILRSKEVDFYLYNIAKESWEAITGEEREAREGFEEDPDYMAVAGFTYDDIW